MLTSVMIMIFFINEFFYLTLDINLCRNFVINGERSSVGRAPVCGTGCRGFEPHRSPQF